jgi:hypothetical protein
MSETKAQRRKGKQKFKKAPQAPRFVDIIPPSISQPTPFDFLSTVMSRRFKSAYMFFSIEQHKKIRNELNTIGKNERVSKSR